MEVIDNREEPTCTNTGITEGKHCSRCNKVLVAGNTIPALGHDFVDTVIAPTCKKKGYTLHKCRRCNQTHHRLQ